MTPLVSVCMPCYNAQGTAEAAIRSALCQDAALEVIAVDDCSTDGTAAILQRMAQEDPRVRVVTNERNMGAAASRNRAAQLAKGRYIACLDADDLWVEGKLKRQLSLLEKTGAVLCCTGRELMTWDGKLTGRVIGVRSRITYRDLLRHNSINCSSVVIRREAFLACPMEHEDSHEDYITWLKVLRLFGDAVGIDEPLLQYRLSASGKSGSKLKSAAMTMRVYRYMGFGPVKSLACFVSYAVHGIIKYLTA